jgi:hypothetical protein
MIPQGGAVHRFILETFATTGHAPTREDIQAKLRLTSVEEAEALIAELEEKGCVHRKAGDHTVTHAYPFSHERTQHRVHLAGGPQVYAMCAMDALGMPFMLKCDAEIHSLCTQCQDAVTILIQHEEVRHQSPSGLVVWFPTVQGTCVAATDLCPSLNFFCSAAHLNQWCAAHPEKHGEMLTLEQALVDGRKTFEPLLQEVTV